MANTDPEVLKQKQIGGIDIYHAMGYKGQGFNVMQLESDSSAHGLACVEDILDIAPECKVYRTGISMISNNETVKQSNCSYNGKTYTVEDFIREYKIKIITQSTGGKVKDPVMEAYWQDLIDKYNLILVTPAGNEGSDRLTTAFPVKVSIVVGGVGLSDKGIIKPKYYTGQGDEVDFAYFTGDQEGTSFAAPRLVGVMLLLMSRFGDKSQAEIYEMLKALSKDVDAPGVDVKTGWGVPILNKDDDVRLEGILTVSEKTKKEFIEKIGKMAHEDMKQSGILASLTIAQAILESYWGQSGLTKRANNLFGIKGSYNGKTTVAGTQECYDGQWVTIQAGFRVYPSWEESIADHSNLFNTMSRYANLRGLKDYKLACEYVQKDGYATDPSYASKLINLIETYKLYQYDKVVEDLTREETEKLIREILLGAGPEPSAWAKEPWEKAKSDGITDGTNPKGYITREQAVAMIMRAKEK